MIICAEETVWPEHLEVFSKSTGRSMQYKAVQHSAIQNNNSNDNGKFGLELDIVPLLSSTFADTFT